jgi:superfamily II DNA or RNA helicase
MSDDVEFNKGQLVQLKSDPAVRGVVTKVTLTDKENRYEVFIDGTIKTFYHSQLLIHKEDTSVFEIIERSQFNAYLTALQIRNPGISKLYSLNSARIDYIPYQFRPVLKFIRSDRPRLLIADDVGVGKTIEAGLIIRELKARRDIKSILIICPRPLVTEAKWQMEMKRFEERFTHLDGKMLRHCINETDMEGIWPNNLTKIIVPYSLLDETLLYGTSSGKKMRKGLLDLDQPPRFDLVIVDEAHHIRNIDTYAYKVVRFFCENADAALFLTATPIQLGSNDLFVLLNVLRPDLIIDKESFEHMAAPNPYLNRAIDVARAQVPAWQEEAQSSLIGATNTPWGQTMIKNNPEFLKVQKLLEKENTAKEERIEIINSLEQLHTFSGIINRTRRRDIGNFTIRRSETVSVEFTPLQRELHDKIIIVQSEIMSRIHGNRNVQFMMTTIRRQAASCINGLAPMLKNILTRRMNELEWDEADVFFDTFDKNAIDEIQNEIREVIKQAEKLDDEDPKLEALRKILSDKQFLNNNKVMVFSSFRHTLSYLYKHLLDDGLRVELVHGDTPDEERVIRKNRFQLPQEDGDALDVLLFSEIGCEGLDYQFCDCMVNYDLPWNPMKIEQRIGRIDRNGQKSEFVTIYNMIIPGTVDADIYERCLLRIGVFNEALGGSEEILGRITREIHNIADNLDLTEKERNLKLQLIADNEIQNIKEQQELEKKQVELFGIKLPAEQMQKEIENASSYWLSPVALENLALNYLQRICDRKEHEFILGKESQKTLRIAQDCRNQLLKDFYSLSRQSSEDYRIWKDWLKGGDPHLPITFDAATASENPNVVLITPLHPLVQQAALICEPKKRIMTSICVKDNSIPEGKYPFAIYQWEFHGIHKDIVLRPITECEELNSQIVRLLENGQSMINNMKEIPDRDIFDKLDKQHYNFWVEARKEHQDKTRQIVDYRKESLKTSHKARMELLNEQLSEAEDEKIKRMRLSQIASAEGDYSRHMQELDNAVEKVDMTAQAVAFGIIYIKRA